MKVGPYIASLRAMWESGDAESAFKSEGEYTLNLGWRKGNNSSFLLMRKVYWGLDGHFSRVNNPCPFPNTTHRTSDFRGL